MTDTFAKTINNLDEKTSDWHLWEARDGTLRPLLPGDQMAEGCEQLWARRNAHQPWRLDIQLDRGGDG